VGLTNKTAESAGLGSLGSGVGGQGSDTNTSLGGGREFIIKSF